MSANPRLDWNKVRARLAASEQAFQNLVEQDPDRIARAYRERAARLAARGQDDSAETGVSVLVFRLRTERYGLELTELAEIRTCQKIAPVPGEPPHLLGVVNLNGDIRPVCDLAALLGLRPEPDRSSGFLLVLRTDGRPIALRVDSVEGIVQGFPQDGRPAGRGGDPDIRFVRTITSDSLPLLDASELTSHVFKGKSK